ncbi:MAG: MerR family transcriptional regulator [Bacteroidetes bacterium]|nr:MAG: MerR family transcriptional regulator [Bacteroidota bacterium]
MIKYSINDLEKITGIKAHTIRIWEKRYNVVCPQRTDTNIRFYNDEDLKKLLNISTLNKHGFKISDIIKLSHEGLCQKVLEISNTSNDYESYINNLIVSMIEMDEDKFEKVLTSAVIKIGFERTITNIIYKFLEKVGLLWQVGTINPAQEHFITNLIRQKLILAIDGQENSPKPDAKTFLLFLPEKELHELGLLFYSYIIKRAGHRVIYLGQSVPLKDILEVIKIRNADFILTYFVAALDAKEIPLYLKKISEGFSGNDIFITGYQVDQIEEKLPQNIKTLRDAEEFKSYLNRI